MYIAKTMLSVLFKGDVLMEGSHYSWQSGRSMYIVYSPTPLVPDYNIIIKRLTTIEHMYLHATISPGTIHMYSSDQMKIASTCMYINVQYMNGH